MGCSQSTDRAVDTSVPPPRALPTTGAINIDFIDTKSSVETVVEKVAVTDDADEDMTLACESKSATASVAIADDSQLPPNGDNPDEYLHAAELETGEAIFEHYHQLSKSPDYDLAEAMDDKQADNDYEVDEEHPDNQENETSEEAPTNAETEVAVADSVPTNEEASVAEAVKEEMVHYIGEVDETEPAVKQDSARSQDEAAASDKFVFDKDAAVQVVSETETSNEANDAFSCVQTNFNPIDDAANEETAFKEAPEHANAAPGAGGKAEEGVATEASDEIESYVGSEEREINADPAAEVKIDEELVDEATESLTVNTTAASQDIEMIVSLADGVVASELVHEAPELEQAIVENQAETLVDSCPDSEENATFEAEMTEAEPVAVLDETLKREESVLDSGVDASVDSPDTLTDDELVAEEPMVDETFAPEDALRDNSDDAAVETPGDTTEAELVADEPVLVVLHNDADVSADFPLASIDEELAAEKPVLDETPVPEEALLDSACDAEDDAPEISGAESAAEKLFSSDAGKREAVVHDINKVPVTSQYVEEIGEDIEYAGPAEEPVLFETTEPEEATFDKADAAVDSPDATTEAESATVGQVLDKIQEPEAVIFDIETEASIASMNVKENAEDIREKATPQDPALDDARAPEDAVLDNEAEASVGSLDDTADAELVAEEPVLDETADPEKAALDNEADASNDPPDSTTDNELTAKEPRLNETPEHDEVAVGNAAEFLTESQDAPSEAELIAEEPVLDETTEPEAVVRDIETEASAAVQCDEEIARNTKDEVTAEEPVLVETPEPEEASLANVNEVSIGPPHATSEAELVAEDPMVEETLAPDEAATEHLVLAEAKEPEAVVQGIETEASVASQHVEESTVDTVSKVTVEQPVLDEAPELVGVIFDNVAEAQVDPTDSEDNATPEVEEPVIDEGIVADLDSGMAASVGFPDSKAAREAAIDGSTDHVTENKVEGLVGFQGTGEKAATDAELTTIELILDEATYPVLDNESVSNEEPGLDEVEDTENNQDNEEATVPEHGMAITTKNMKDMDKHEEKESVGSEQATAEEASSPAVEEKFPPSSNAAHDAALTAPSTDDALADELISNEQEASSCSESSPDEDDSNEMSESAREEEDEEPILQLKNVTAMSRVLIPKETLNSKVVPPPTRWNWPSLNKSAGHLDGGTLPTSPKSPDKATPIKEPTGADGETTSSRWKWPAVGSKSAGNLSVTLPPETFKSLGKPELGSETSAVVVVAGETAKGGTLVEVKSPQKSSSLPTKTSKKLTDIEKARLFAASVLAETERVAPGRPPGKQDSGKSWWRKADANADA